MWSIFLHLPILAASFSLTAHTGQDIFAAVGMGAGRKVDRNGEREGFAPRIQPFKS